MRLGLGLGVKNSGFVGGYDSATSAFLAATGITSKTESDAVNNLVLNLKSYGLWSKMKAIYPFVSDTYNLLSYTEDFSNIYWNKGNTTVTTNSTTAPDGTATADSVIPNTTNGGHSIYVGGLIGGSQVITCTIYAKAKGYNYIGLSDATTGQAVFDLSNGTLVSQDSGITASTPVSAGNGWYRCQIKFTASTNRGIGVDVWNNSTKTSYAGNNIDGVYLWGAQLEQASSASTYQPIATTPAARFVSQFKYNLKDPRDLDAAFRLAFNGTWTYSKQGATPNGVNGYANTYLNPVANSLTSASSHLSYYARTAATTTDAAEIANYTDGTTAFVIQSKAYDNSAKFFFASGKVASKTVTSGVTGLLSGSAVANTRRDLYFNGVSVANNTTTDTATLGNYNLYLGAGNINNTSVSSYSNAQASFATIGNGLTDSEMANLYTSVQLFQQELSRYVGVPIVSDANAQAFLNAAVITDQTQANAVNTLVTDLKTYGLWTKMKAIYPFVGGTATTHKWNLKDPRDLDAAYRLAFSGAWTHSSTGALPNGANAYANTYLTPSTSLGSTFSLSYYSNTDTTSASTICCEIGAFQSGLQMIGLSLRRNLSSDMFGTDGYGVSALSTSTNSNFFGIASRSSTTSLKLWKNTTLAATNTSLDGGSKPTIQITLALNNGLTGYSNRRCAFSHIGDGLSDTEVANLYTAVNKFQTSLSRNV